MLAPPARFSNISQLIRDRGSWHSFTRVDLVVFLRWFATGELAQFFAEMEPGPVNCLNFPVDSQRQFSRGLPKSAPEHTITYCRSQTCLQLVTWAIHRKPRNIETTLTFLKKFSNFGHVSRSHSPLSCSDPTQKNFTKRCVKPSRYSVRREYLANIKCFEH